MSTPIRRLEGITYWVVDDPHAIYDFVNSEILKEWETDVRSEHRNPKDDLWLKTLSRRKWHLETTDIAKIKLNPDVMNFVDFEKGYKFSESLEKRSLELRQSMALGGVVLSPFIVRNEDFQLVDGYCRYTTLKAMNVSKVYTYVGILTL